MFHHLANQKWNLSFTCWRPFNLQMSSPVSGISITADTHTLTHSLTLTVTNVWYCITSWFCSCRIPPLKNRADRPCDHSLTSRRRRRQWIATDTLTAAAASIHDCQCQGGAEGRHLQEDNASDLLVVEYIHPGNCDSDDYHGDDAVDSL